jgi:hypothetical protein
MAAYIRTNVRLLCRKNSHIRIIVTKQRARAILQRTGAGEPSYNVIIYRQNNIHS